MQMNDNNVTNTSDDENDYTTDEIDFWSQNKLFEHIGDDYEMNEDDKLLVDTLLEAIGETSKVETICVDNNIYVEEFNLSIKCENGKIYMFQVCLDEDTSGRAIPSIPLPYKYIYTAYRTY